MSLQTLGICPGPPEPANPLVALMQQTNDNINGNFSGLDRKFETLDGKIEAQKQELKQELKSSLADAVQEHVEPLRHQMKSMLERLSILEGTTAKPGTSSTVIPPGPASAPPGLSLASSFPDSTGAVEVQSKLNKWANPAARDVKLVKRNWASPNSVRRRSTGNTCNYRSVTGTLALQNGRKSTFQGWEGFRIVIRNFMEILQTVGLVSIS